MTREPLPCRRTSVGFTNVDSTFPTSGPLASDVSGNDFHVSPRLGFTINLPTAKRTALKAGFGSYNEGVYGTNFNFPVGGSTTHRWTDTNGDGLAQPGEFTALISTSIPARLYPQSKRPHWVDYSVGVERELIGGFSASLRFMYRDNKDIFDNVDIATAGQWIPVTVYDAGPDRVRGNADDIGPVQAFDLPRSALGTQRVASINPEGATRHYKALETTATKRLAAMGQDLQRRGPCVTATARARIFDCS
jgi:hypothetical protein